MWLGKKQLNNIRQKWDERYRDYPKNWFTRPRPILEEHEHLLPASGLALDIAMGAGENSSFLINHGLSVIGIDISGVAVRQAKQLNPKISACIANLEEFSFPPGIFDVIMNFYYLQRGLIPKFQQMLKPGGLVIFETLTRQTLLEKPDISPRMLLAENELASLFTGWEVLFYREGRIRSDHGKMKSIASIITRLPEKISKE